MAYVELVVKKNEYYNIKYMIKFCFPKLMIKIVELICYKAIFLILG